jgi:hypothetical protein
VIVDVDDQYLHGVPDTADRVDAGDISVGQFADVAQAIFAREDFDERAEVANAGDDSVVDLADLDRCGAGFDSR